MQIQRVYAVAECYCGWNSARESFKKAQEALEAHRQKTGHMPN